MWSADCACFFHIGAFAMRNTYACAYNVKNSSGKNKKGISIMKKTLALVLAVLMLALSVMGLSACGKVCECEGCGEEARCKEVELLGEKLWLCPECQEEADALKELGEELEDAFS